MRSGGSSTHRGTRQSGTVTNGTTREMRSPSQKLGDILPLGQRVCIFRDRQFMFATTTRHVQGARVSQFLSTLLLVAAVVLTVCFGVAAWRLSDEKDIVTSLAKFRASPMAGNSRRGIERAAPRPRLEQER